MKTREEIRGSLVWAANQIVQFFKKAAKDTFGDLCVVLQSAHVVLFSDSSPQEKEV